MTHYSEEELRKLIQQALITVEYDYREAHHEILGDIQALINKAVTKSYRQGYEDGKINSPVHLPVVIDFEEEWLPVVGFEKNYEVSNTGRVRSIKTGFELKRWDRYKGYLCVSLHNKGKTDRYVHRIVADAFIPNPDGLTEVNHIDGNPSNNLFNNLEWCTPSQNQRHAYKELGRVNGNKGNFQSHCVRGHELSEETTIIDSDGYRQCKECRNLHAKNYRKRKLQRQREEKA